MSTYVCWGRGARVIFGLDAMHWGLSALIWPDVGINPDRFQILAYSVRATLFSLTSGHSFTFNILHPNIQPIQQSFKLNPDPHHKDSFLFLFLFSFLCRSLLRRKIQASKLSVWG